MSVVFSSYTNKDNNKNGYFRIGNTILNIPPSNITTDRIINNDRRTVLRGKNEMFTKSGQARWDVTVSWMALIDHNAADPYEQWDKVQNVVAMFKAAPFVEVENAHIRQIFTEKDSSLTASRLAFGMRQLKVDTHPDIVDGLVVTLTMTYFNYQPYSLDFSYAGSDVNQSVDASKSSPFTNYLNEWKVNNLVNKDDWFHAPDWRDQITKETGKIGFNWKEYKAVIALPKGLESSVNSTAAKSVFSPPVSKAIAPVPVADQKNLSQANIAKVQTLNGPAQTAAFAWLGDVSNHGFSYTITSARRRTTDSDPGTGQSQTELYTNFINAGGAARLHKPGGPKYLVAKPGFSKHESGNALDIQFTNNAAFNYAYNISNQYGFAWFGSRDTVHWTYTGDKGTPYVAPQIIAATPPVSGQAQDLNNLTDIGPEIQALLNDDWVFDYLTEDTAYFFRTKSIILRDEEHRSLPHARGLNPSQMSVLFVNNLSQIPLANFQYPTYQHVGPASSLLSIQITSVGEIETQDGEPIHSGLQDLTSMSHTLEEQFIRLRTNFRSVKSVHGMQAVFVENAILNMIGIFGILPEQLSTEIIPDSSNMVQVNFIGHQYENMHEETSPYKVNGITGSYATAIQNIVAGRTIGNLSSNEKSQLTKVVDFQKDYDGVNFNNLGKWLITALSLPSNGDFIANLQDNPVVSLPSNAITPALISAVGDLQIVNSYPVLNSRFNMAVITNKISVADFYALKALPGLADKFPAGSSGVLDRLEATVLSHIDLVKDPFISLYKQILPFVANADPVFASQLQKLIASPMYKPVVQAAVNADNPSSSNDGHGSYKDLGLKGSTNPDDYFVNDQDRYASLLSKTLGNVFSAVASNANSVAGLNDTSQTTAATTTGFPTDVNKLMKMVNVPGYSMKEAFPTFKLFFIEDANSGVYYAFDSFYSYSSVLEIEVIRPWDKPATAVIRLTNLSNLFDHKLFDDTLVGKHEAKLARFSSPEDKSNEVTTNTQGTSITVSKNPISGIVSRDLREGMDPNTPKLIPLKYFPLQTGTKIQIRMGFDNDPDKLTPVFNGLVTEIEPGEEGELIVTAQSYLLELSTISATSARDSRWDLGSLASFGAVGPAYGGIGVFKDNGDTGTVIKQLLSASEAKHFGHWQLNGAASDTLLKGYNGWQALAGSVATDLGYTNLAAIINNAYDRSGENIMVNTYVDFSGTSNAGRGKRNYLDESNQGVLEGLDEVYSYYIDNKLDWSVWELIRDVSRRYPEYILLEKFYGFPYEADATLVFGNPLDWYYTRPALIGDDETLRAADSNGDLYKQWWASRGKDALTQSIKTISRKTGFAGGYVFNEGARPDIAHSDYVTVNQALANSGSSYASLNSSLDALIAAMEDFNNRDIIGYTFRGFGVERAHNKDTTSEDRSILDSVKKDYLVFVTQTGRSNGATGTVDDRIKPIRKYHFIDHNTIVHNGIKLNDKIFNLIKINGEGDQNRVIKANGSIPEQHLRSLDVSSRLNDPQKNVIDKSADFFKLIGQSFLREEVGKMYRGELILRGVPEIEPMDILILLDASTGIVGPVEVDQVVHSFTQEMGYVTIVKPRALVVVNETAGAVAGRRFGIAMASVVNSLTGHSINDKVTGSSIGEAANNAAGTQGPIAGLLSILVGGAFCSIADSKISDNPIVIQPLFRFNRPWVGGLEGFDLTGFTGTFSNLFEQFKADEVFPLMDLYKLHNKIVS